jgi:hypothetical protein
VIATETFKVSGATVALDSAARKYRIEFRNEFSHVAERDYLSTFEDLPAELLHGYHLADPPGAGFVFAYGRLSAGQVSPRGEAARRRADAYPLLDHDPDQEPGHDEWQSVQVAWFPEGLWVAELPGWCQWLRLRVAGSKHVFFRPERGVLRRTAT